MLEIDHVILAVPSMDDALAHLVQDFGLVGIPTSASQGPIATAIVPFGNEQYLEVLALTSSASDLASTAGLARRLATEGAHFWGFAVRTSDIALVASRTKRPLGSFNGKTVRSRTVRPANDMANQLPFFIEYLDGTGEAYLTALRGGMSEKPAALRFAELSLSTDPARLGEWLDADLPTLRVHPGDSGLRSVGIETAKGTIRISYGD